MAHIVRDRKSPIISDITDMGTYFIKSMVELLTLNVQNQKLTSVKQSTKTLPGSFQDIGSSFECHDY